MKKLIVYYTQMFSWFVKIFVTLRKHFVVTSKNSIFYVNFCTATKHLFKFIKQSKNIFLGVGKKIKGPVIYQLQNFDLQSSQNFYVRFRQFFQNMVLSVYEKFFIYRIGTQVNSNSQFWGLSENLVFGLIYLLNPQVALGLGEDQS